MLRLGVESTLPEGAARTAVLDAKLRGAWQSAAPDAVQAIRAGVERAVVERTSMDAGVARKIVTSELDAPTAGGKVRGRVGLTDPPERIYPRTAQALSFVVGGRRVFAKSVRGSRPYKLVGRGARDSEGAVRRIFEGAARAAARG